MYISILIYHIFFIHCLEWTLGLTSIILAIVTSATMNLMVHQSFQISVFIFFFFFRYIPRRRIAGSYGNSVFNFFRTTILFSTVHASSYIPTNYTQEIQFFHILVNTCYFLFFFFIVAILIDVRWHFIMVLMYISLITSDVNHLVTRFLAI